MSRGGFRAGAGRPRGARNRRTEQAIAEASAGETPVAYLLRIMRDRGADSKRRDEAARALLPYLHARLAPKAYDGFSSYSDGEETGGPTLGVLGSLMAKRVAAIQPLLKRDEGELAKVGE